MERKNIYRRKNRKNNNSKIISLSEAQKIIFAPFTFQVIGTMLDLGLLKLLEEGQTIDEIIETSEVSIYGINVLLQAGLYAGIVQKTDDDKFIITTLGANFLHDEMTINNFNFMRDVCYLGASELTNSIKTNSPAGLQKFLVNDKTIYPHVPNLEPQVKKSWYDFDHYYSATCFDEILPIIFKDKISQIFDIGGNTGRFEKACLAYNNDCRITMIDLPINEQLAKDNINNPQRFDFIGMDVLSETPFPKLSGAIFISQFLDCFSFEQVSLIFNKIKNSAEKNTKIYILEPIIDNQFFDGAKLSLAHISLYFTCIANGNSKMFLFNELKTLIEKSGLKIENIHSNIGIHDYTLWECVV